MGRPCNDVMTRWLKIFGRHLRWSWSLHQIWWSRSGTSTFDVENPFQLSNQRYVGNIMLNVCVCCLSSLPDLAYGFYLTKCLSPSCGMLETVILPVRAIPEAMVSQKTRKIPHDSSCTSHSASTSVLNRQSHPHDCHCRSIIYESWSSIYLCYRMYVQWNGKVLDSVSWYPWLFVWTLNLNISTSTTKFYRNEFRAIKNLPVDERWQLSLAVGTGHVLIPAKGAGVKAKLINRNPTKFEPPYRLTRNSRAGDFNPWNTG